MQIVIQFFSLLISGVSNAFSFFLNLFSVFESVLVILPHEEPNNLVTVLLVCFGIIVSIRVLELLP